MLTELIDDKEISLVMLFIILVLGIAITVLIKRFTNDLYSGVSAKLSKRWKNRQANQLTEIKETEGETDDEEDWSKRKAILSVAIWSFWLITMVAVIEMIGMFMRPVFWSSVKYMIFAVIMVLNISTLIGLGTLSFFYSATTGKSLGVGKTIKSKSNLVKGMLIIAISFQFSIEAIGDLKVYRKLASQYCLSDLPGFHDKFIASRIQGVSIDEVDDKDVRALIRAPAVEKLIDSGTCLE